MTQAWVWAGAFAVLAAGASWGASRQARRRDLDRPGWVPWQLVTVLAATGALAATGVALKT